jgi:hypothetical protein
MAVATLWVVAIGVEDEVQQELMAELAKLQEEMSQSQQQAQERQRQQQQRLEKLREAMQARRDRQEKREVLKQQQREQARAKKKAKASKKGDEMTEKEVATVAKSQKKALVPSKAAKKQEAARQRAHRVSLRGLAELNACWHKGKVPLPKHLHPETWPKPCHPASTLTEAEFLSQLK